MSDEKNDTEESEAEASKAVPEAANDDDGTPEVEVESEVESEAEAECAAEPAPPTPEEVIADLEDQLLRALAETQNVRRRAEREQSDARRYATADFARDVLTVADNLSRAIETAKARDDEAAGTVIEGVELTLRQLEQMLEKHEIRPIEAMGPEAGPEPASGDDADRASDGGGRHHRSSGADRLHRSRSAAAPGARGRGQAAGRSRGRWRVRRTRRHLGLSIGLDSPEAGGASAGIRTGSADRDP